MLCWDLLNLSFCCAHPVDLNFWHSLLGFPWLASGLYKDTKRSRRGFMISIMGEVKKNAFEWQVNSRSLALSSCAVLSRVLEVARSMAHAGKLRRLLPFGLWTTWRSSGRLVMSLKLSLFPSWRIWRISGAEVHRRARKLWWLVLQRSALPDWGWLGDWRWRLVSHWGGRGSSDCQGVRWCQRIYGEARLLRIRNGKVIKWRIQRRRRKKKG